MKGNQSMRIENIYLFRTIVSVKFEKEKKIDNNN